jgi:hypothetical protein
MAMMSLHRPFRKNVFASILVSFGILILFTTAFVRPAGAQNPVLTRSGNLFLLDGVEIHRFGLRAANALQDDTITQWLIDNLDAMKSHGIQSVNVSLQGANTGDTNAFNPDGTLIPAYTSRLANILDAIAQREMVGVVTYFYQQRDQGLADDDAVREAVQNATEFLLPWRNVWLYVINEPGHQGFDRTILKTSAGQQEIFNLIKSIDSSRLVFVSNSANDGFSAGTAATASNGNVAAEYPRQDEYAQPGVFTSAERTQAQNHATATFNNLGYWFWHAAWHQKADAPGWPKFDEGGQGTESDPGSSFIWNTMQSLTDGGGPINTPTPDPNKDFFIYAPWITK